jgi:NAD(P)-dependent dehydrogenase (short-subunit alcohol dehydrogenase family)
MCTRLSFPHISLADTNLRSSDPVALEEEMLAGFKTNVIGTVHLFNLFLPLIFKGQQKKVIFISSGNADLDLINKCEIAVSGPYSVDKAGGNVVVAKFHAEYAKEGVLFMSISPGVVDTGHFDPAKCELTIPTREREQS